MHMSIRKIVNRAISEGCYLTGKAAHLVKREKLAYTCQRLAARHDHPRAQFELGKAYYLGIGTDREIVKGFRCLLRSARQGNPKAMLNIAAAYDVGRGAKQDPVQSFRWYERAAKAGEKEAYFEVARRYRDGIGVPRDLTEAEHWYLKANQGEKDRHSLSLAELYLQRAKESSEPAEDLYRAEYWISKAHASGRSEPKRSQEIWEQLQAELNRRRTEDGR